MIHPEWGRCEEGVEIEPLGSILHVNDMTALRLLHVDDDVKTITQEVARNRRENLIRTNTEAAAARVGHSVFLLVEEI